MENTTQFYNLSDSEMLALCKRVMNLEPARRDCIIEREDGIDIDEWIMTRVRSWYARLLNEGPQEWLPIEDLKDEIPVTNCGNGVIMATISRRYVRPVEWKLEGWHNSVTQFVTPDDNIGLLQRNPWTRGGVCQPVAVDHGNRIMLYSLPANATPVLAMARCVALPADGRFVFHQAALPALEQALTQHQEQ